MFEYKCMHVFLKTKWIFKYKCMHVYARGYGTTYKNTVQALKHPSADAVTQNGHKSDTTAANYTVGYANNRPYKTNDKIRKAAIVSFSVAHENGQCQ